MNSDGFLCFGGEEGRRDRINADAINVLFDRKERCCIERHFRIINNRRRCIENKQGPIVDVVVEVLIDIALLLTPDEVTHCQRFADGEPM